VLFWSGRPHRGLSFVVVAALGKKHTRSTGRRLEVCWQQQQQGHMVDDAVVMRAKPEGDLLLSSSSPGSSSQEVVSRREGLRFLQQRPQRRWIEVTDNVRREYECASSRPECRLQVLSPTLAKFSFCQRAKLEFRSTCLADDDHPCMHD